jgi:hypothetical protein
MQRIKAFPIIVAVVLLWMSCNLEEQPGYSPDNTITYTKERLADRTFPSVFQAWNPADNLSPEDPLVTLARHDLLFSSPEAYFLQWDNPYKGLAVAFTADSIELARDLRAQIHALNPNLILLAEIRYRDAPDGYLPADSPWWKRDGDGNRIPGWAEGDYYLLDYLQPEFRAQVAAQCVAVVQTGVVDGVMLDWWMENEPDKVAFSQAIRSALGDDYLIIVNSNHQTFPHTGQYLNGCFMECYQTDTGSVASAADWNTYTATLAWAKSNCRPPVITCLETWYHVSRTDPADLARMRATTTLSLSLSDGYCLFSDPNSLPTPDHLHDWYSAFWDKSLGRPVAPGVLAGDGSYRRDYQLGTAVSNPPGNATITVTFAETRRRLSSGASGTVFSVPAFDGDIFVLP